MKYQLKDFNRNIPDKVLLDDLKRVAEKLGATKLSSREYDNHGGKYTSGTVCVRFGTWNKALEKTGLNLVHHRDVSEYELFKNVEQVWLNTGQQPIIRDMKKPKSKYSSCQYVSKFGSWRKSLEAFVEFINSDENSDQETDNAEENILEKNHENKIVFNHKTKRLPSERLKVQVLMRDGNKCRLCGIAVTGENIHFDHILPWSKGGETTLENIQVLCETHNLAKGNLDYQPNSII